MSLGERIWAQDRFFLSAYHTRGTEGISTPFPEPIYGNRTLWLHLAHLPTCPDPISTKRLFPFTGPANFLRYHWTSLWKPASLILLWCQEAAQQLTPCLALSHFLFWPSMMPYAKADMAQHQVQAPRGCLLTGSAEKVPSLSLSVSSYFFSGQWLICWKSVEEFSQLGWGESTK